MECDLDSFGMGLDKLFSDLELDDINVLLDTVPRHKVDMEVHFPFHLMLVGETDRSILSASCRVRIHIVWPLPSTAP